MMVGSGVLAGWLGEGRAWCNSLEPSQVQPLVVLPSQLITMTLSSIRMTEMKNGSFSELSLTGLLLSTLLPEPVLVFVDHAAVSLMSVVCVDNRGHVGVSDLCCRLMGLISMISAVTGDKVDVHDPSSCQKPSGSP